MAAKSSLSLWGWLSLLLLLGAFVAFILFLDQRIAGNDPAATGGKSAGDGTVTKPTIDFYEVLKDRKVDIPLTREDRVAIENPTPNKQQAGRSILQVGSFQSAAEADSLKAQLAFLGLEATVRAASVDGATWHRVQLGPFGSETSLSRAKNLLIANRIDYIQRSVVD